MITPKNLIQHELIGLDAEVADGNPASIGIRGKIVDETMSTLVIEHKGKDKKVLKKNSTFLITLKSDRVRVAGEAILARPEDRLKKKVKRW